MSLRVRIRSCIAALAFMGAGFGCDEALECTFEERRYRVDMTRELPPDPVNGFRIEACVDGRCKSSMGFLVFGGLEFERGDGYGPLTATLTAPSALPSTSFLALLGKGHYAFE
jgi:hypothetical protein